MSRESSSTSRRRALALALSITALFILVNANAESLTGVNQVRPKDSAKKQRGDFARLIDAVLTEGKDGNFGPLSPVIGLPDAMPFKFAEKKISRSENGSESRACYIIVDKDRPYCAYIVKFTTTGKDSTSQFYRLNLDGKLDKAVVTHGKRDEQGKPIKGSGVKFDQDIDSPEIRKAFDSEMAYWLKDWLKKEKKTDKKAAEVAKPVKTASL